MKINQTILFVLLFISLFFVSSSISQNKIKEKEVNAKSIFGLKPNWTPIPASVIESELLNEGFESGAIPPTGWTHTITNSAFTWYIDNFSPYEGVYNATLEYDPALVPQDEWLISPSFSLASATNGTLSFAFSTSYFWHVDPNDNGDMFVKISSDGGTTWTDIWIENDFGVFTSFVWYEVILDISAYAGQSDLKVAFEYVGVDGAQYSLDKIVVTDEAACIVENAASPSPDNYAANVPVSVSQLTWTNSGEAVGTEVWFGTDPNNLSIVAGNSTTLLTSYNLPSLDYMTIYYWRIITWEGAECSDTSSNWAFATERDSNDDAIFYDDFENGFTNWNAITPNDICDWGFALGNIPFSSWGLPGFPGTAFANYAFASSDACGALMNVYLNGNFSIDLSQYQTVWIEFDSDFEVFSAPTPPDTARVDVSVDGGLTWTETFLRLADAPAEHVNQDISSLAGLQSDVRFRLVYYGDFSWHWAIDNFTVFATDVIPVDLTSFTAYSAGNGIKLNWQTATETNNYGFDIERKQIDQQYTKVGFVAGFGTTTEAKNYNFIDNSVTSGSYTYRLKQIDFDGTVSYSSEVNAELNPTTYSLNQNYPNPFNPNTKIDFSIASDSKVTLKIFNVLGQEVITLINGNLSTGVHSLDFNASGINSGVYFYTLEATGIDGTNFNSTKKMILTK